MPGGNTGWMRSHFRFPIGPDFCRGRAKVTNIQKPCSSAQSSQIMELVRPESDMDYFQYGSIG